MNCATIIVVVIWLMSLFDYIKQTHPGIWFYYVDWRGSLQTLCQFPFLNRRNPPELFLGKSVLKICSNVTEITLRHGCPPVNLLHIFGRRFLKNTSKGLLLFQQNFIFQLFTGVPKLYFMRYLLMIIWVF